MPRNARKNRPLHAHLMSDTTPSPPAHLPTPLPDLAAPVPLAASTVLDHLIDFEQPEDNPKHVQYTYPLDSHGDADSVIEYRSPPFREAQLPPADEYYHQPRIETPPPLPIPPRIHQRYLDEDSEVLGHTRAPTLPRSPTRLESISRTIKTYAPPTSALKSSASAALRSSAGALRTYVPSSIHIPVPSAGPSPPLVSRPLSFGRFSVDPELSRQEQCLDHSFDGPQQALLGAGLASYPRTEEAAHTDPIAWAHWDILSQRRVLIIGYTSGLQIWDCHDLGSVTEVLNLRPSSENWALDIADQPVRFPTFVHAGVLPVSHTPGDLLGIHRPLLGILMTAANHGHSAFFVYSLKTHQIIRRLALPGVASTFESNPNVIVISTTLPPIVHIFSAITFQPLWTMDLASLAPFSPSPNLLLNVSLASSPIDPIPPRPIFALSHRLLAYASPRPHQPRRVSLSSTTASGASSASSSPFGFTQSDIGSAALKVGGTVLSGMKFLGGIAYEAAKTRVADVSGPGQGGGGVVGGVGGGSGGGGQGTGNRFFSRSAPTDERPFTNTVASSPADKDKVVVPHPNPVVESGYYVTVLDLSPLWNHDGVGGGGKPIKVAEFRTSQSQPIARLAFSHDGCHLIAVPENGQVIRVFGISPVPAGEAEKDGSSGSSLHMYDLRRGRTSVLVEGLDRTVDGRWMAIGTRNRTLHIFSTNPYGGKPDIASHLEGRVKNIDELPSKTEVTPIVRLRPLHSPKPEQLRAPLAFVFVRPGDVHLPSTLLPPIAAKYHDPTTSPPVSPHHAHRVSNTQDILVFDPTDGILSLRRVVVDQQRSKDQLVMGLPAVSKSGAVGAISRSLPGNIGSPGRLSGSPGAISRTSSTSTSGGGGSGGGGPAAGEIVMDLAGKSQTVATWSLQRKRDWEEVRKVVVDAELGQRPKEVFGSDWLAQAELSTCSRSPRVLPRSLYLSHQFTFWNLGEDYHALLRQYHFDIRGGKIQVRREVQVSIGVGLNNTSDRFVDDLDTHPGDARASFDEPLASALAGDLGEYTSAVPAILPMYPNGVSGAHSSSFIRNSIPIRRLGDNMSEGFGRIRREISTSYHRTMRSPSLGPRRGGDGDVISVPLEFDEEDEDFLGAMEGDGAVGRGDESGGSAESGALIVTPGTSSGAGAHDRVPLTAVPPTSSDGDDVWAGWESREVKQTVEEIEKFDDISVVGFLDEEHQQERARARAGTQQTARARKGRRPKKAASQGI